MPTVFVTGATGFLGSHLVDCLLAKGWDVHALVRKSSNLQWLLGKKIHYHYGDLVGDLSGLRAGIKEADYCFHLAGVISAARAQTYYEVNAQGTANLLETACKHHPTIKKIIIASSLAAHGPGEDGVPVTEQDECHPITDYGKSKRDAELIALRYRDQLPITIIRPPAIYGPRDRQIYRYFWMARKGFVLLPGRGSRILNIAYVQDIVNGLLLAAENSRANGEIFYIGDQKNYEWEEVAEKVAQSVRKQVIQVRVPAALALTLGRVVDVAARVTGRSLPVSQSNFKNFLQKNWALDVGKATQILGYHPQYPLDKGVEETAAWYFEQGWLG